MEALKKPMTINFGARKKKYMNNMTVSVMDGKVALKDGILIPLGAGKNKPPRAFAIIDPEMEQEVRRFKWHLVAQGYVNRWLNINGIYKGLRMHRFIMNAPDGVMVDHINGNYLDNRKANLRLCTHADNAKNAVKRKMNGVASSSYKGVHRRSDTPRWRAEIYLHKKKIALGTFETEKEAALAYNEKSIELFGEFARINVL